MSTQNKRLIILVRDALDGKQDAFRELFDLYSNAMFNICMRMTRNRQESEDIVQESFIKAFQNLRALKHRELFGSWLRAIVVNNCIRQAKNKLNFNTPGSDPVVPDESNSDWIRDFDHTALYKAINNLPDGCRQIFLLYVMEEYSHKKIASVLNISESTSKSQYARAKKLLKEQLIISNG